MHLSPASISPVIPCLGQYIPRNSMAKQVFELYYFSVLALASCLSHGYGLELLTSKAYLPKYHTGLYKYALRVQGQL